MKNTGLILENVSKEFTAHILDAKRISGFFNLSFSVATGTALGLVGPSGSGKSSILKCIYRTYLASGGRIIYRSKELGEVDMVQLSEHAVLHLRKGEIGYVTQFLNVLPRVAAVDVVAEPLVRNGTSRHDARKKAQSMLARLRIPGELCDAYPVTFSGGEKQRVNLARSIIHRPCLLLLDEPTASLDKDSVNVVLEMLRELKEGGTTMIIVCHEKTVLEALTETVFQMPEKESGTWKPNA